MTVEASSSKCAHPPRSNRPRSSSSGPPGPCITPSTETCAVVVSFIVVAPLSLGLAGSRGRSMRPDRGAVLIGRSRVRPADPFPHPPRTWPASTSEEGRGTLDRRGRTLVDRARAVSDVACAAVPVDDHASVGGGAVGAKVVVALRHPLIPYLSRM